MPRPVQPTLLGAELVVSNSIPTGQWSISAHAQMRRADGSVGELQLDSYGWELHFCLGSHDSTSHLAPSKGHNTESIFQNVHF